MQYLSTLWYTENSLIDRYQSSFLGHLQEMWKKNMDDDIPTDEFLLFPDYHSLLIAINNDSSDKIEKYKDILRRKFIEYKKGWISLNTEEIIPGTQILLTLDFENPYAYNFGHPDHIKQEIGIRYGSISPEEWRKLFASSFEIVKKVSPGFMDEINRVVKKIIPFDVSNQRHNSGSYGNAIGHLVMSYPIGMNHPELAVLEAILHEYNHNKLNLITQTDTLVLNDMSEMYYSPYRPDPRHIRGIYLGLHALAWAFWVLWNAHRQKVITLPDYWIKKAVLYVLKNGLSIQVLSKYARLTDLGNQIFLEMQGVHKECLEFIKQENIDHETIAWVKYALTAHFQSVKSHSPGLLA